MELAGLTYEAPLLSAYSILKFAVAVWLFSRTLPARGSMVRQVGAAIAVLAFAVVSYLGGFSIFPPLQAICPLCWPSYLLWPSWLWAWRSSVLFLTARF